MDKKFYKLLFVAGIVSLGFSDVGHATCKSECLTSEAACQAACVSVEGSSFGGLCALGCVAIKNDLDKELAEKQCTEWCAMGSKKKNAQ
jgi:hypothetical protein